VSQKAKETLEVHTMCTAGRAMRHCMHCGSPAK
jgi:hypothetical protein